MPAPINAVYGDHSRSWSDSEAEGENDDDDDDDDEAPSEGGGAESPPDDTTHPAAPSPILTISSARAIDLPFVFGCTYRPASRGMTA